MADPTRWHVTLRTRCQHVIQQTLCLIVLPTVVSAQSQFMGVSVDRPSGSDNVAMAGLVASYDMRTLTDSGLLRDFSAFGNHGRISGTVAVPAVHGSGLRFRVAYDRIHIPENASLAIDGPLTLALWVRFDALNIHQHILACDDKFALWVTPENRVRFSDTLGHGIDSADPVKTGRWYSLVAVFDGTYGDEVTRQTARLYIDGSVADTRIVNRTNEQPVRWVPGELYPTDACYIGFESHQGNVAHQRLQFEGAIDEILIFNRAIATSEIAVFATTR